MRNRRIQYGPDLGSQAKCLTISQHTDTPIDEDISGKGKVADKAKEIVRSLQLQDGPPSFFLLTAYGDTRLGNNPLERSTDEAGMTELDHIANLFHLRPHTKDTISRTIRAYFFHEIEYDPVCQHRMTAVTFFVRAGRNMALITCSLRIELPSLHSVAFVCCKVPAELAELRNLCLRNERLLRTTPLGILALIYAQLARSWEEWVADLYTDLNEIEVLLDMVPPGWGFYPPTPQRAKELSDPDMLNRQFAATHAQICHSQTHLAYGVRFADHCREAMDLVEQARPGKRLQPGEREMFEACLRPSLSICKSVQDRSTDLLERLRGVIGMTTNMIAQREARTNRDIAHSNLRVAQSAASDSRMMKTLGLLGVLFLPATFTTALWQVNLFQLEGETNKIVYGVTTVGLTLLVLGAWGTYMHMARKPFESYRADELGASMELRPLV
ncbi:hypothetical protein N658DRAFT_509973 [Parathielavia hyrcaniae]|uniref:Uncharacterized protein n=1 Tax=Parathielavia hyrcaniae TaxID=113614 RepID=A0AAN6SYD4_9PEZI|nr:hypothetical protein N658DRAFT_509973 [Parathielavia hyrcaniae]